MSNYILYFVLINLKIHSGIFAGESRLFISSIPYLMTMFKKKVLCFQFLWFFSYNLK